MLRVRDVASAGQLVTLLALLAGTLSVALARNHGITPQPSLPMRPLAITRLIAAMQLSTPFTCGVQCRAHVAWRKLVGAGPHISAALNDHSPG